ncbi:tail fiber assembly protein [Yersinia enterocolitica]|uniref:tail fiber assembly protein n=1 Tax=Yersinia enterocolitica TaxID=630 RepID=UPI003308EB04|nr:tail fiber assembly protein [Yersinia enterocolitica]
MTAKFSPSAKSFYPLNMIDDGSYSGNLPNDLIDVTDEELANYWKKSPPDGKKLDVIDGRPAWVDLPPPTHEELVSYANEKKSQLKATADSEIAWRKYAVDGGYAEGEEATKLAEWQKYSVLLMRINTSKGADISWPNQPK